MNAHTPQTKKPAVGAAGVFGKTVPTDVNSQNAELGQARSEPICITGLGSNATLKYRPHDFYDLISWDEIVALVDTPTALPKADARWIIGSKHNTHKGREHAEQLRNGVFGVIYADIDQGNPSRDDVDSAVVATVGDDADFIIYSSSGASEALRKWRIIVRLAEPLAGVDFTITQNAFFDRLEQEGLICDRALNRTGQVIYTPNVPPERRAEGGKPLFYQTVINEGVGFDLAANEPLRERLTALRQAAWEDANKAEIARANAAEKRAERTRLNGNTPSPIDFYNQTNDLETVMASYGYDQVSAVDWISPNSESRGPSVRVYGDRWVSLTASDDHIGRRHGAGTSGDAFDLFVAYGHKGNRDSAMTDVLASLQEYLREQNKTAISKIGAAVTTLDGDDDQAVVTPDYVLSSQGKVLNILTNAMKTFECLPAWLDVFAFDTFQDRPILTKGLPGQRGNPHLKKPILMTDNHYTLAHRWFQDNGFDKMPRDAVINAIDAHCIQNEFHPIRNWLDSLRGSVVPDANLLDRWLFEGMGSKPTTPEKLAYTKAVGRAWLIGAVARVVEPGCKMDTVLIFEGKQGVGKSTALRHLAGDDYFRDSLPDMAHKDASDAIRGSWIIELGELAAMNKADVETQKSFITRQFEMFRPSYGRLQVKYPRQCVLAASTNKTEYLRDETGGRRFWPVRAGVVDLPWIKANREALWAEALAAYEAGEQWHLTPEVEALAAVEQAARLQEDALTPAVMRVALKEADADGLVSFTAICNTVFAESQGRTSRGDQNRVTAALVSMGAEKVGACWVRGERYGHVLWRLER